jgi:hypothetical protein
MDGRYSRPGNGAGTQNPAYRSTHPLNTLERYTPVMDGQRQEKPIEPGGEQETGFRGNGERFAAQARDDIDPRLSTLLSPIVGPDRQDPHGTIELTVIVDGTIISGSVASEEAWSRRQNAQVNTASDHLPAVTGGVGENGVPEIQVRFIHFLEPVVISGGNPIHLNATRVDLRKVAAWSIGRLQYGEK